MEQITLQPQELRIGNWFYEKLKSTQSLEKIPHRIINGRDIDNSEFYSPIPLTPDILEKCGFECIDDMWGQGNLEMWAHKSDNKLEIQVSPYLPPNQFYCLVFIQWRSRLDVCIKYLHQLQNLYFALCGKELEITI